MHRQARYAITVWAWATVACDAVMFVAVTLAVAAGGSGAVYGAYSAWLWLG